MYFIYNCKNTQIPKSVLCLKINPKIKSAVLDYLTSDFSAMAVLCIALFFVIIHEFAKDAAFVYELKPRILFFMLMTVIFSLGFMGIIESIRNINWKFHALLSANNFKYHVKRTVFFLIAVFGWLFVILISIGIAVNVTLLLKYLFCIMVLFFITVFIAFTITNTLLKAITLLFLLALTVWISVLPALFLPMLIIPVIPAFIKAKNEYREWYLL